MTYFIVPLVGLAIITFTLLFLSRRRNELEPKRVKPGTPVRFTMRQKAKRLTESVMRGSAISPLTPFTDPAVKPEPKFPPQHPVCTCGQPIQDHQAETTSGYLVKGVSHA